MHYNKTLHLRLSLQEEVSRRLVEPSLHFHALIYLHIYTKSFKSLIPEIKGNKINFWGNFDTSTILVFEIQRQLDFF